MWHKNVGSDGDGSTGNLNEPSWIISVDASISLTCSRQNKKYSRIPAVVKGPASFRASLCCWARAVCGPCVAVSFLGLLSLGVCSVFMSPNLWYQVTWVVLSKGLLNGCCFMNYICGVIEVIRKWKWKWLMLSDVGPLTSWCVMS